MPGAPAALIYLPPFPILSLYRHTDRYLLIFYCHNRCFRTRCPGIRLPDTDTGYRELRTTRPGLSRFFSWPSSALVTFVGPRSLGYWTTRTTLLSRAASVRARVCVYDHFAMTVYIGYMKIKSASDTKLSRSIMISMGRRERRKDGEEEVYRP